MSPRDVFAAAWRAYRAESDEREWLDLGLFSQLEYPRDANQELHRLPATVREAALFWSGVQDERLGARVLRTTGEGGGFCVFASSPGDEHFVEFFDEAAVLCGAARVHLGRDALEDCDPMSLRSSVDAMAKLPGPRRAVAGAVFRAPPLTELLRVKLRHARGGTRETLTDEAGRFHFAHIAEGPLTLECLWRDRAGLWVGRAEVTAGDEVSLELRRR